MKCTILALETSCDETSAAVVADGYRVKSNIISSQVPTHQKFGGVVPEIASRKHLENITVVIQRAMDAAGVTFGDLDAIAVTYGPGLVGALLVGVSAAKAMAYALRVPLLGVHHLVGHIYANFLEDPGLTPPLVCLVVSGGHTSILYMAGHGEMRVMGRTRDDAAGEAFDKVARAMGLGYPGGPAVEKLALEGNPLAIDFPRAWLEEDSLDFSFSGLKSAVLNLLNRACQAGEELNLADVAAGFQQAVVEVLVEKTVRAARQVNAPRIILAGGVAANNSLRRLLTARAGQEGLAVGYPSPILCTDNAAMIACAGYFKYLKGEYASLDLNAVPNLPLEVL
ncbi:O-sialoglycoprotein endopeptidase [Clostridiales bacterium PH28_bin88]|nr:O-sialoglycoprotein endopeptidase [Clostridiales bacterium PH28_bin88]